MRAQSANSKNNTLSSAARRRMEDRLFTRSVSSSAKLHFDLLKSRMINLKRYRRILLYVLVLDILISYQEIKNDVWDLNSKSLVNLSFSDFIWIMINRSHLFLVDNVQPGATARFLSVKRVKMKFCMKIEREMEIYSNVWIFKILIKILTTNVNNVFGNVLWSNSKILSLNCVMFVFLETKKR